MNDKHFNSLCERLDELAGETSRLPHLPPEDRKALEAVSHNARAQHFRLVLVSPFQGGKSTLFNTICGGRELSPTGQGLKTSAAVAEARYLKSDRPEYAEILWRDQAELLASIIDPLLPYLDPKKRPDSRAQKSVDLAETIDLERRTDRQWLLRATKAAEADLAEILALPAADRDTTETGTQRQLQDTADLLRVAWLTLTHYEAVYLPQKSTNTLSPSQATDLLAFPEGWDIRDKEDFRTEELSFLYLRRVVFWLREAGLRHLRASIIDCPGLHASNWDTYVTSQCISEAHAVIFLLGSRSSAMSQDDLDDVLWFEEFKIKEGIFFGYNARMFSEKVVREEHMPNDLSRLKKIGFQIPEDRLSIFNGLLACRARTMRLERQGKLPEETVQALSRRALKAWEAAELPNGGTDDVENARHLIWRELKKSYEDFTGGEVQRDDPDLPHLAERRSKWPELIERVSGFVISRQAQAILVDRGAAVLRGIVGQLRAELTDRELAATKNAEETIARYQRAEASLKKFKAMVNRQRQKMKKKIEQKATERLFAEFQHEIQKSMKKLVKSLVKIAQGKIYPKGLKSEMRKCVNDHFNRRLNGWLWRVRNGESAAARKINRSYFTAYLDKVRDEAQKLEVESPGLLMALDSYLGELSIDVEAGGWAFDRQFTLSEVSEVANEIEDATEGTLFGDSFSFLRTLYRDVHEDLVGKPQWTAEGNIQSAVTAAQNAFLDAFEEVLQTKMAEIAERASNELARVARSAEKNLARRIQHHEADSRKSSEEKAALVEELQQIRNERIAPLEQSIEDMIRKVSEEAAAP